MKDCIGKSKDPTISSTQMRWLIFSLDKGLAMLEYFNLLTLRMFVIGNRKKRIILIEKRREGWRDGGERGGEKVGE